MTPTVLLLALLAGPALPTAEEPPLPARASSLLEALRNDDTRKEARAELLELGPAATPALLGAMDDPSFSLRWELVNLLGRSRDPRGLEPLIERVVADENAHVRWRASWALRAHRRPERARHLLRARLATGSEVEAWNAAVALASLGDRSVLPRIHGGLDDEDSWRRWEAVHALGRVHGEGSSARLEPILFGELARHRREAALSLGRIDDDTARMLLRKALESSDPGLRWRAAMGLSGSENRATRQRLAELAATDPSPLVREHAERALTR